MRSLPIAERVLFFKEFLQDLAFQCPERNFIKVHRIIRWEERQPRRSYLSEDADHLDELDCVASKRNAVQGVHLLGHRT